MRNHWLAYGLYGPRGSAVGVGVGYCVAKFQALRSGFAPRSPKPLVLPDQRIGTRLI